MGQATPGSGTSPGLDRIPACVWQQAAIIVLGAFTAMLSATIVNAQVPGLARDLHTSPASAQWVASGYLLALAAAVPMSAWMARRVGPTRLWLCCLALFCGFSVWCALSGSIAMLLIGRVLQGAAGGLLVPAGQAILGAVAGKQRMGRVMSTIGIPMVVAPTLGTMVGSMLSSRLAWPWLFWITIPLPLVALVLGLRRIPRLDTPAAGRLDWPGLVGVVTGLALLIYGLTSIGEHGGLGSTSADAYAAAGIVLLAAFAGHALRSQAPALHLRLFGSPVFAAAAAVTFFGGLVNFGAQIILPLYFTQARHESALTAGLLIGAQVIGTAIGFPLAGRLTDRYGGGRLLLTGGALTAVATLPLALVGTDDSYLWICAVLFVRGFGVALGTIPAMTVALASVARDQLPDAAPIVNMLQRTGAAMGTALVGVLYATHLAHGRHPATDAAHAFGYANWWLVVAACLLTLPAWTLTRAEQRARARTTAAA